MKIEKLKQLNILLADDDMDDCIFFKEALNELTIPTNFKAVHDGEQLMQFLTTQEAEKDITSLPDVLFLDLNMPRKNGFECLYEIKLSKKLQQLPVIIFSTSFEQEVVNLLYKNGAHYFIRKPSEFSQFVKIIHQTLELIVQENSLQRSSENFVLSLHNV